MRVALGWLSEWISLPGSREELVERLTLGGLEIEGIESTSPALERGGQILPQDRHRNPLK